MRAAKICIFLWVALALSLLILKAAFGLPSIIMYPTMIVLEFCFFTLAVKWNQMEDDEVEK